ncbi:hypothetical protein FCV25MIE_10691, partial [Fagus crenata]
NGAVELIRNRFSNVKFLCNENDAGISPVSMLFYKSMEKKDRAMRMSDAALSAVTRSSKRDLDEFVKRLHEKLDDFKGSTT